MFKNLLLSAHQIFSKHKCNNLTNSLLSTNRSISWEDLKLFHKNSDVYFRFPRNIEVEQQYERDRKNGRTDRFINSLKESKKLFVLTHADYPYDLENGLIHMVLWIDPIYDNVNVVDAILDNILFYIPKKNIIFFQNTKKNRSVPELCHYHVIINNRL
jgi:Protein of unknown function (DUF3605)